MDEVLNKTLVGTGVNYLRQSALFNPLISNIQVHVVGLGATGSHVVDALASMGISDITGYDFDKVESHNLPNQAYFLKHVGMNKTDAIQDLIKSKCGFDIKAVNQKVEKLEGIRGVLIMCTDSMECQKSIVMNSTMARHKLDLVIETRMGLEQGRVYAFDPGNKPHRDYYLSSEFYTDAEALESPCNARAVGTTAKILAAVAAHKVIKRFSETSILPFHEATLLWSNGTAQVYYFDDAIKNKQKQKEQK